MHATLLCVKTIENLEFATFHLMIMHYCTVVCHIKPSIKHIEACG